MKTLNKEEFLGLVIEYSAIGCDAFTEEMTDAQREAVACAERDMRNAENEYGDKESDDYCEEAKSAACGWLNDFNQCTKTQIADLINGNKNVIRDESHAKYATAKKSTSHNGFAGTDREERNAIAEKVFAENGNTMNVTVRGIKLALSRGSSTTGKTSWYSCNLSEEEFKKIAGYKIEGHVFAACEGLFIFTMNADCTCSVTAFARKSAGSQWKARSWWYVGEEFVTIL